MPPTQPATLRRRIAAFMIDYAVLAAYIAVLSAGFALLPADFVERLFATPTRGQLTAFATLTAPVWLYFAVCEASHRQATVGKRALRMHVVTQSGARVGWGRSLLRSGLKLVPWELAHTCLWRIEGWPMNPAPPGAWQLTGLVLVWVLMLAYVLAIAFTPRRQSLYDLLARTLVVRARE